jgi:hypothetical protein
MFEASCGLRSRWSGSSAGRVGMIGEMLGIRGEVPPALASFFSQHRMDPPVDASSINCHNTMRPYCLLPSPKLLEEKAKRARVVCSCLE